MTSRCPGAGIGRRDALARIVRLAAAPFAVGPLLSFAGRADAQTWATSLELSSRVSDGRIEASSVERPSGVAAGKALGLVDAPFADVMRVLVDFPRYGHFLPLREVRVTERERGRAKLAVTARARLVRRFSAELDVRIEGREDGTHVISARKITSDLDALEARFQLVSTPSRRRSLVSLELLVDPGLFLPDTVLERANVDAAVVALARLRKRMRELRAAEAAVVAATGGADAGVPAP